MKPVLLKPDKVSRTLHGIYMVIASQIDAPPGHLEAPLSYHWLEQQLGDGEASWSPLGASV